MKRAALLMMTLVTLTGMSKTPTADPMPDACEVLEAIGIAATLGPGTVLTPITKAENNMTRLSLCSADTPDLSARMTLMVRENLMDDVPDASALRDEMAAGLRNTVGASVVVEDVAIGDAATWVGEIGQLTVWHRAGRVMFIFSPTPLQDRAVAEAAAQKVLAAFP